MDEYCDVVLQVLLNAVNDQSEVVRICAIRALAEIGKANSDAARQMDWLSSIYPEEVMAIALETGFFTDGVKRAIFLSLQRAPGPVIELAARALAKIGNPIDKETGCEYLRQQVIESEFDLRRECSARALGYLGCLDSRNIATLIGVASQDPNGRVRVSALESLCLLGYHPVAIPCLKEIAIEEKDWDTKLAAMLALTSQQRETGPVIREAQKALRGYRKSKGYDDARFLNTAIECIRRVGKENPRLINRKVIEYLKEIVQSHEFDFVRMNAMRALADIEEDPDSFLYQSLQNGSRACRSFALGILIQRGTLLPQNLSGFTRGTDIDWRVLSGTLEKGTRVAPDVRDKIVGLSSTANWDEKEFALLVLFNLSAFGEREIKQAIEITTNRTRHESVRGRAVMLLARWYKDQVV